MTRRSLAVAAVVSGVAVLVATVMFLPGLLVWYDLGGAPIAAPDRLEAVTDARAVEQLGSDKVDVRIGAVFALTRIAHNSPDDRDAVIATLCAFARGHSPWPPRLPDQPPADAELRDVPTLATRANDVQAAVTALARIPKTAENEWLHLPLTDLRRGRLWRLNLDHALFGSGSLRGARLWETSLVEADLGSADLREADLKNADLRAAVLWNADLRGAELSGARLEGAIADHRTKWPEGFDPDAHGVVRTTSYALARYRPGTITIGLPPGPPPRG